MTKKALLMMSTLVCIILLASCKKDYTCSCTYTDNGPPVTTTNQDFPLNKMKKKDAQAACDANAATAKLVYDNATCTLK
jgi:hypothetical protein